MGREADAVAFFARLAEAPHRADFYHTLLGELRALGIEPAAEGNREVMKGVREHLAQIRAVVFEEE